jgi:hypothetical protein
VCYYLLTIEGSKPIVENAVPKPSIIALAWQLSFAMHACIFGSLTTPVRILSYQRAVLLLHLCCPARPIDIDQVVVVVVVICERTELLRRVSGCLLS